MAVVYETESPAAPRSGLGPYRAGDCSVRLPEEGVYRSAAVAGLELDVEAFWRELPETSSS